MKIAVCCSSSNNIDAKYLESSKKLLDKIFSKDNELVFGGANSGIMGVAYETAKKYKRNIIGIATEMYKEDLKKLKCDIEILTKNVNERTSELINNSDILLFLPGGIGTLDEFTTAIEMKRSKEIDKPIIIYNEQGFFDELMQMLKKIYAENFTSQDISFSYDIVDDYKKVMDLLGGICYEERKRKH